MIIRLSHPWRHHHTLDVLDSDRPRDQITEDEARHLIRAGFAVDVRDLIRPRGNGWYDVTTSAGVVKVHGNASAIRALKEDAGQ